MELGQGVAIGGEEVFPSAMGEQRAGPPWDSAASEPDHRAERVDRECLAPETQYGKRTESELLRLPWQAPSWISVPPFLTSNSHLYFLPFRAVPSPNGQQVVPVSCWTQLEPDCQPQPTPHGPPEPGARWGLAHPVSD